ncbi:MAG: type II toxin-antitoxin system VapC family toxin [Hydrococcus sp. Prado102]|nr:type II toxin-antitoxin system VapC family toxin [Hydrococcus sp. Prado102]
MKLNDTNVLMYAAGAAHAHKASSVALLERVGAGDVDATIDAEVLQEILHRYRAIGRWADGRRVFDLALALFPEVLPVGVDAMRHARVLMDRYPALAVRDAVHAGVARAHGITTIISFDTDFDVLAEVAREQPV